jgi:UDP-glucose 4-epimerase
MAEERVLITGGAGFIGSHLAEHLRAAGRSVVLVDDLSTGRRANVAHLLGPRCELVVEDVAAALRERPALLEGVGEVYHLAASVGVQRVVEHPAAALSNNLQEREVLEAARRAGAAVLFASSSEVYGKSAAPPFSEEDDLVFGPPTVTRWGYGLSKAVGEQLALAYGREHGMGVVATRLFNTIGPRQVGAYGMVVPRFVEAALEQRPIPVYGDGQQVRTFCDVRDVVAAMVLLLQSPPHHGRVYNLGSEEPVTIEGLADRVLALTGGQAGKRFVPYHEVFGAGFEEMRRRIPDLRRIREAIGFDRRWSLEDTLRDLIQGFHRAEFARPEP